MIRPRYPAALMQAMNEYNVMVAQAKKLKTSFELMKDKTTVQAHAIANRHNSLTARLRDKQAVIDKLKNGR